MKRFTILDWIAITIVVIGFWLACERIFSQQTKPGMPTPVMEPPQLCAGYIWIDSAGIAHCPTQAISGMSHHSTQMAVPDTAEREQELQEEREDCYDADPVMEKYPMCQKR